MKPAVWMAVFKTPSNSSSSSTCGVTRSKNGMLLFSVIFRPRFDWDGIQILAFAESLGALPADDGLLPSDPSCRLRAGYLPCGRISALQANDPARDCNR